LFKLKRQFFGLHFKLEFFFFFIATFWAIFGKNWAIFSFSVLATLNASDASYCIENKEIKVAKWGTPKNIYKEKKKKKKSITFLNHFDSIGLNSKTFLPFLRSFQILIKTGFHHPKWVFKIVKIASLSNINVKK
jgi:hypothetical protein